MSAMWIRVKKDGFIYPYDPILAKNSGCEVIPEEVAFPERFITAEVQEAIERHSVEDTPVSTPEPVVAEKPGRGRKRKKAALDLSTDDIPDPPQYTPPELAAEAARGLP